VYDISNRRGRREERKEVARAARSEGEIVREAKKRIEIREKRGDYFDDFFVTLHMKARKRERKHAGEGSGKE
jgi:hypothetical protein